MVKCSKITLDLSGALKRAWSLYSCLYPMSLICFISTMLVINQSCNGTIKALHGQARNKKIVNIVKVIYLPQ